jgi:enoyl-CoA hydratase/carnithine racemase
MSNDATSVTLERREGVFLIGLNRVAKRNAFDSRMLSELASALGEYERDPALRCALVALPLSDVVHSHSVTRLS